MAAVTEQDATAGPGGLLQRLCRFAVDEDDPVRGRP